MNIKINRTIRFKDLHHAFIQVYGVKNEPQIFIAEMDS